MKALLLQIVLLFACISYAQTDPVVVVFDVNFKNIKTAQENINGVVFDGKKYHQIKQGKGSALFLPGEHDMSIRIAVVGNPEEYRANLPAIKVDQTDTVVHSILIPDSYLPSVNRIALVDFEGPFYPGMDLDTMNCYDAKGQKQGLWFEMDGTHGDCIDKMIYRYTLFRNDTVRSTLRFTFDYNLCEEKPYWMLVKVPYPGMEFTQITHQYKLDRGFGAGLKPGEHKGFDHNYLKHHRAKEMFREFESVDYQSIIPTFIKDSGLKGVYTYKDSKTVTHTDIP